MHQVLQCCLGCYCVVHEGRFEGVILVIANDTGRQCVVADQVCDYTPCRPAQHRHVKLLIYEAATQRLSKGML